MSVPTDAQILMCCEASFTGQLLDEFKHTNIADNHVSQGFFHKGYKCAANTGYFEWHKDGSWKFVHAKYPQSNTNNAQTAFEQVLIIANGVKCPKQAQKSTSKNAYRVLAELNGKLCIIDSEGIMSYPVFVDKQIKVGVKHALYLDMGQDWNYSYYCDNDNKVHYIHNTRIPYTTNWIVFRK